MKFFLFLLSFLLITNILYCVRLRDISNNILSIPNSQLPSNNSIFINENSKQPIANNSTKIVNINPANNSQIQNITNNISTLTFYGNNSTNQINKNNNTLNSTNLSNNNNILNTTKSNKNTNELNITNPFNTINNPLNSSVTLNQTNSQNNTGEFNETNPQNGLNQTLNNSTIFNKTMARINSFLGEESENDTIEIVGSQNIMSGPLAQGYVGPQNKNNLFVPVKPGDKVFPRILVKGPIEVEKIQGVPVISSEMMSSVPSFQGIPVMINNQIPLFNSNNSTDVKGMVQQNQTQLNDTQLSLFSVLTEKNIMNNSKTIVIKKNYPGIKPKSVTK